MARAYFCAYHSYRELMELLTDEECGRLFKAALLYSMSGKDSLECLGNERFIWTMIRGTIERDKEKYEMRCEINRINGMKGGRPREENRSVANGSEKSQEKEKGEREG